MAIITERGRWANSTVDERGKRVFANGLTERGQKVFGLSASPPALVSTVKSNTTSNAAVLVDRMAESSTSSSSSSTHNTVSVSRAFSSTVKSNSSETATLTVTGGTLVAISSTVKSNSNSYLVSRVSRLLMATVKSNSSATGGLRNSIQVLSNVKSTTTMRASVTVTAPNMKTALTAYSRSNTFAKVVNVQVTKNVKSINPSKTRATAYLLNLQVVSQLIETIKFKRGNKATLPSLQAGEPAFTLDTDEMFVGSSTGNIKMLGMIIANSVATLPTPGVNNHWMICGVLGNGTTTADALYICKMLSNGTYDWVQFA